MVRWAVIQYNEDHSLGRDSMKPVFEEAMANRETICMEFFDTLFAMKAEMTCEEWNAVFHDKITSQGDTLSVGPR